MIKYLHIFQGNVAVTNNNFSISKDLFFKFYFSGFWDYKFRNVTENAGNNTSTELQKLFASYVAIASNVPNATFIILHAIFGHLFSMKLRLYGSQVK